MGSSHDLHGTILERHVAEREVYRQLKTGRLPAPLGEQRGRVAVDLLVTRAEHRRIGGELAHHKVWPDQLGHDGHHVVVLEDVGICPWGLEWERHVVPTFAAILQMPLQLEVVREQRGKHVRPGAQLRRVELAWEHDEAVASEGLDKGCDLPRAVPNHRFSLKTRYVISALWCASTNRHACGASAVTS